MISCIKEIKELAFTNISGIEKTRNNPTAIIIEEEIRTSHLVIGSNSITKNKKLI